MSGALPHETVDVEITSQRSKMWYGRTVAIQESSPDRVPHIWPLAEATSVGGVNLGHVSLSAQHQWKASVINTQMRRLAQLDTRVEVEPAPGDQDRRGLRWRTRLDLSVNAQGRLAMNCAHSHDVVAIDGMPLAHEDIISELHHDITRRHPQGTRRYVYASDSGLLVTQETSPAIVREKVATSLGTWSFEVDGWGFFQVHREAPKVLLEAVIDAVGESWDSLLDLYSGVGLLAIPLAEVTGARVTAVEIETRASQLLSRNARTSDVEVRTGDARIAMTAMAPGQYEVVVCDPPRAGLKRESVNQIAGLRPELVVYVACDPASLARDVGFFHSHGYELTRLRAFDLFPMTHHVECVAVLANTTG